MLVKIPAVLRAEELAVVRERLANAPWADGKATAGYQSAKAKNNLQLPEDCADARELGQLVVRALERSPLFIAAALPRHLFPPLFNRYQPGMAFGAHVDNAIRQVGGTAQRLRTDISATLFLSHPADYDGGELLIGDAVGSQAVKLPAGDMVVYPATTVHRVAPVTSGRRDAAFFWVQSLVKEDSERSLLFQLDRAVVGLAERSANDPALVPLTALYHNLVRKWSEL